MSAQGYVAHHRGRCIPHRIFCPFYGRFQKRVGFVFWMPWCRPSGLGKLPHDRLVECFTQPPPFGLGELPGTFPYLSRSDYVSRPSLAAHVTILSCPLPA